MFFPQTFLFSHVREVWGGGLTREKILSKKRGFFFKSQRRYANKKKKIWGCCVVLCSEDRVSFLSGERGEL